MAIESTLILNDGYLNREMVYKLETFNISLRCVKWARGIRLKVVLEAETMAAFENYMNSIGAVRIGYWEWEMASLL